MSSLPCMYSAFDWDLSWQLYKSKWISIVLNSVCTIVMELVIHDMQHNSVTTIFTSPKPFCDLCLITCLKSNGVLRMRSLYKKFVNTHPSALWGSTWIFGIVAKSPPNFWRTIHIQWTPTKLVHMTLSNTSVLCTSLVVAHCIPLTKLQKGKHIFLPIDYGWTSYMSHPQDCRKMSYIIPPNRPIK